MSRNKSNLHKIQFWCAYGRGFSKAALAKFQLYNIESESDVYVLFGFLHRSTLVR